MRGPGIHLILGNDTTSEPSRRIRQQDMPEAPVFVKASEVSRSEMHEYCADGSASNISKCPWQELSVVRTLDLHLLEFP